jgi:hypothetical protein
VLTQTYAEDLDSVLFSRVFSPIGITHDMLSWRDNASRSDKLNGIKRREIPPASISASMRCARIGILFLRRGV